MNCCNPFPFSNHIFMFPKLITLPGQSVRDNRLWMFLKVVLSANCINPINLNFLLAWLIVLCFYTYLVQLFSFFSFILLIGV